MRLASLMVALLCFCPGIARAQATPAPATGFALEGVTLGEPMQQVREAMGDPVRLAPVDGQQIWRYVGRGGAVYVDVLAKNNWVFSVTVLRRFASSPYTDDAGIDFGSSAAQVRAKRGEPSRTQTNADDGSVDLWYVNDDIAKIYEFYSDRLGFVQILPSPKLQATFAPAPAVVPDDGSSIAAAIVIRPSNLLSNSLWIDAYLADNSCGSKGHWKLVSSKMSPDEAAKDILAYTTVHAQCTDGGAERDFIFDTHGMVTKTGPNGSQNTIYIDASQLRNLPSPAPSASPTPR
jgi:hypothetical protein